MLIILAEMLIHCTHSVQKFITKEVVKLEVAIMAVRFLGWISIILCLGFVLCLLAIISYNTYIKYQDKHKKIEVRAENSNNLKKR